MRGDPRSQVQGLYLIFVGFRWFGMGSMRFGMVSRRFGIVFRRKTDIPVSIMGPMGLGPMGNKNFAWLWTGAFGANPFSEMCLGPLVPNKSFGSPVQAPLLGESIFRIPTLTFQVFFGLCRLPYRGKPFSESLKIRN